MAKKNFFARLIDKFDSKLEEKSKNKKCCCSDKDDPCCKK